MKTAIYGAWHVHAADYARDAIEKGELIGFYEEDDILAARFQERFDVPRFATEEELLASEAEGIIITTATCEHKDGVLRVAKAKKKIFIEKVLALTDEDCREIKAALEENGAELTISMPHMTMGSRMTVKAVAQSGELGKINYVRFRNCHAGSADDFLPAHFYDRRECGGGAMIDLGAHGMYLIHGILGMPEAVSSAFTCSCESEAMAEKNSDRVEDNAVTLMRFANGAIAINETGFVSRHSPVVFEVHGEDGCVRMEGHRVIKRTKLTGGKDVEVAVMADEENSITRFVKGLPPKGCGIEEAIILSRMMTLAYGSIM